MGGCCCCTSPQQALRRFDSVTHGMYKHRVILDKQDGEDAARGAAVGVGGGVGPLSFCRKTLVLPSQVQAEHSQICLLLGGQALGLHKHDDGGIRRSWDFRIPSSSELLATEIQLLPLGRPALPHAALCSETDGGFRPDLITVSLLKEDQATKNNHTSITKATSTTSTSTSKGHPHTQKHRRTADQNQQRFCRSISPTVIRQHTSASVNTACSSWHLC